MSPSTVLVTGASRFIGGRLAGRLAADPEIDRVLAVDTVPPGPELLRRMGRAEFVRAEFVRADLSDPLIAKVISRANVDTVVHASTSANPPGSGGYRGGRSAIKQMNVIGTMQLLAA
jgi:UDP-glucose 4-epimerase